MSGKSKSKPAESPSPIGEISQEPSALESFLDANQKKLLMVGILVILILVGYVIYDGLREMSIRDEAATVAAAKTVPEYEKVSQEMAGKTTGGTALLLKTELLWQDQQQQEALSTLQDFISSYPEHPALGSAYARLGSYHQQLGNTAEAKEAFNKTVETQSATSSWALLSLGDLAREAGENDEAKSFYERIINEYETSHFQVKALARERLKMVGVTSPTEKAPEPEEKPEPPKPVKPAPAPAEEPETADSPTPQPGSSDEPETNSTPQPEPTTAPTGEPRSDPAPEEPAAE